MDLLTAIVPEWHIKDFSGQKVKQESWIVRSQPHWEQEEEIEDDAKTICDWIQKRKYEVVKDLVKNDPSLVLWKDEEDRTPLHFAVDGEHTDLVKFLIENKANINAADNEGQTPLHYACVCEHEQIIDDLISRGADPNIKNAEGQSSMDICAGLITNALTHLKIQN